jgi:5-oxoprolinase (ATP-hydrolysing)
MQPGDVYVLNDPYHGGTHLPDVTVITPVYLGTDSTQPTFYVGSRGHHADIGGTTPGLHAAVLDAHRGRGRADQQLQAGRPRRAARAEMLALLRSGKYPSRNPEQNMADLKAQIAANEKGVQELRKMVDQFGLDVVQAYMRHVQDNAEESVRRVITRLKDGEFTLPLDNGAQIRWRSASMQRPQRRDRLHRHLAAAGANNFNAPTAVCMAAVLYVFRTLVDDDIPLNAGCLKPLKVIMPEGCMLNPNPPASVVAGNVETSTCITNALYGALGVMAAGQCTMNNFTFGNARTSTTRPSRAAAARGLYDEAGKLFDGFDGTSVVQTHMTNSRLTDPEVLEFRFPVRLESYEIRGLGRRGRWHGGNGGVRRVRFLEPMTASILSNGRKVPPSAWPAASRGRWASTGCPNAPCRAPRRGHRTCRRMFHGRPRRC